MAFMSSMARVAVAAGLAAVAQALPAGLTAYTGIFSGRYMIKDELVALKSSYLSLGQEFISANSSGTSATLVRNDDNSGSALWAFISVSSGVYNIMCSTWLTVGQGNGCFLSAQGSNVTIVATDSGTGSESWSLQYSSMEQWFIVSSLSNMMLTFEQSGSSVVAVLTNSNNADSFVLKKHMGIYWVYNVQGSLGGRTMLSVTEDGSTVDLWPSDDKSGRQQWVVTMDFFDSYYNFMVLNGVSGPSFATPTYPKYMEFIDGNPAVKLSVYDSSIAQQWNLTYLANANFNIYLYNPLLSTLGSYLGFSGTATAYGSSLTFFPSSSSSAQQWKLQTLLNVAGTWSIYAQCTKANSLNLAATGSAIWIITQIPGENVYTIQTSSQGKITSSSGDIIATGLFPYLGLKNNGNVDVLPTEGGPAGYTRWYINQPAGQTWFYIQPANIQTSTSISLSRSQSGSLALIQMDDGSGCQRFNFYLPILPVPSKRMNDGWVLMMFFWSLIGFCVLNCCLLCCIYVCCCKWRQEKAEDPIVMELPEEGPIENVQVTYNAVPHAAATGELIVADGTRTIEQEEFFELSIFEARQKKAEVLKETEVNGNTNNRIIFEQADDQGGCGVTCL